MYIFGIPFLQYLVSLDRLYDEASTQNILGYVQQFAVATVSSS